MSDEGQSDERKRWNGSKWLIAVLLIYIVLQAVAAKKGVG